MIINKTNLQIYNESLIIYVSISDIICLILLNSVINFLFFKKTKLKYCEYSLESLTLANIRWLMVFIKKPNL